MIKELLTNDVEKMKALEEVFNFDSGYFDNLFLNNPYTKVFYFEVEGTILGYINYDIIYDRMELANIFVLESYRNMKVASKLVENMIKYASENGIKNITLEVRKDNEVAIFLYERYGFENVAVREKYYSGVDGILMEKKMM